MDPLEQVSGPDSPKSWKSRSWTLGIILFLGFTFVLGWSLWKGSGNRSGNSYGPVTLTAELPRYETAQKSFTVRFTAQPFRAIKDPLYLFILSDLPLSPSANSAATVPLSKGKTLRFSGHPSLELPFNGLRVGARKEGEAWVAEVGLNLQDVGSHVLAYWFGTGELWDNLLVDDGVMPEGLDAKRFLPALKDIPFHLGTIEVISQQQGELLGSADKALGQKPDGVNDYKNSSFCKMGFGEEPLQLAKVQERGGHQSARAVYLFGQEKGTLQKRLIGNVPEKTWGPPRTLFSPALGKDLLWIEEGKTLGEKAGLFAWSDGKLKQVLTYLNPKPAGTISSMFITKDGVLHVIHKDLGAKNDHSYLLETYDWDFEKDRYSTGRSRQASYAEFLIESGDYQDFLTRGFTRPHLESLLDYFTNANNEGSTRNGIHNLLVTAAGTDYGDDKEAWRKWFEEKFSKGAPSK